MTKAIKTKRPRSIQARREAHRLYQARWKKANPERYQAAMDRMMQKYLRLGVPRLYFLKGKKKKRR